MTKFIEVTIAEDRADKLISINVTHIIHFYPYTEKRENHTAITLTKTYGSNGTQRHSVLICKLAYEDFKSLLTT